MTERQQEPCDVAQLPQEVQDIRDDFDEAIFGKRFPVAYLRAFGLVSNLHIATDDRGIRDVDWARTLDVSP